ncbi:MAG: EpsG family protein [Burkholderiaceae bacterium]|nr:EpsG family protein [Burkholderiaceae bacterium]
MAIYLVVLLGCSSLLLATLVGKRHAQRMTGAFCIMVLSGFCALRGYVGTDTYSYHLMFQSGADLDWGDLLQSVEPAFAFLLRLTGHLTESSFVFIFLISLIQGILLLRLAQTSRRPAEFLLVYLAIFYLNFHFNILRAGTAVLLLLLANRVPANAPGQWRFHALGTAAVLTHYSALIGFLPILIARQQKQGARLAMIGLAAVAVFAGYLLILQNEVLAAKYLIYSELVAVDDSEAPSRSLLFGLPFYLLLYFCVTSKKNRVVVTTLFVTWLALRSITIVVPLVARVEMIANALLLFWVLEQPLTRLKSQLRSMALLGLTVMWLYGSLAAIANEDAIMSAVQFLDESHLMSPFNPYRFVWEEN